jgi:hypothetical protein
LADEHPPTSSITAATTMPHFTLTRSAYVAQPSQPLSSPRAATPPGGEAASRRTSRA